jgi:ribosome maturation factor RimP
MTHPLVPQVIDLANPIAQSLGLEVVGAVFQTNQRPPILRIDIRNPEQDTSLNDCEQMSRALEPVIDAASLLPDAYVLEISSPGISRILHSDRDFKSFQGFTVEVLTSEPYPARQQFNGQLVERNETHVTISQKGKVTHIPRPLISQVQLEENHG